MNPPALLSLREFVLFLCVCLLAVSCDEDPVDPEAADQVLMLSITNSAALVPTYPLVEMSTAAIAPGTDTETAAAAVQAFFDGEFACTEVERAGSLVTVKFLEEPPEVEPSGEVGAACMDGTTCDSGVCGAEMTCAAPACNDLVTNADETDTDCGGGTCKTCDMGLACVENTDCESGECVDNVCGAAAGCGDGAMNGDETGVDCGGSCGATCADGLGCAAATDCVSGSCDGTVCVAPTCGDAVMNGDETDVDCGGSCGATCADGLACVAATDCVSGACDTTALTCSAAGPPATCTDTMLSGDESDVDCGGACGATCADGLLCNSAADCVSGTCDAGTGTCGLPVTCTDTMLSGDESDVDCGGACGATCADGLLCNSAADCVSGNCDAGTGMCAAAMPKQETPPEEEPPADEENPCEYLDYLFLGTLTVRVDRVDAGDMQITQTWESIANGDAIINSGTATVNWGDLGDLKRVRFNATWDSGEGSISGQGNRSQRLVDPDVGLSYGIRVDGERTWNDTGGTWVLSINGAEFHGMEPLPRRGSYHMFTAGGLKMRLRFDEIDGFTIKVETEGRDGTQTYNVSRTDGTILE